MEENMTFKQLLNSKFGFKNFSVNSGDKKIAVGAP